VTFDMVMKHSPERTNCMKRAIRAQAYLDLYQRSEGRQPVHSTLPLGRLQVGRKYAYLAGQVGYGSFCDISSFTHSRVDIGQRG